MENRRFQMHIHVQGETAQPVFQAHRVTLRDRLLTRLFGRRDQYVVILPSRMVSSISLIPVEGGDRDV